MSGETDRNVITALPFVLRNLSASLFPMTPLKLSNPEARSEIHYREELSSPTGQCVPILFSGLSYLVGLWLCGLPSDSSVTSLFLPCRSDPDVSRTPTHGCQWKKTLGSGGPGKKPGDPLETRHSLLGVWFGCLSCPGSPHTQPQLNKVLFISTVDLTLKSQLHVLAKITGPLFK